MFSLANVPNLFADELASLRGRGLAGPLVSARALDCSLFWHGFHYLVIFRYSWFVFVEREIAPTERPNLVRVYRDRPYASSAPRIHSGRTSEATPLAGPRPSLAG